MTAQVRELLTRLPPSPETDELQDLMTVLLKNYRIYEQTIQRQHEAMRLVREALRSPASNMRFMQIAQPARYCLNILNPFFEK